MISYIFAVVTAVLVLIFDFVTKYYIMTNFSLYDTAPFLKGFIEINYIHNTGAAWGIFSGKTYLLIILTLMVMVLCIYFLIKNAKKSKLLFWAICLVLSGGLGNMYDRIFRDGKVIDFLHFEFWPSFPVFNVADCAIVVGAGFLILYFLIDILKEYWEKSRS